MRLLAEFDTSKEAKSLLDYMEVHGVEVDLREGKRHAVWVLDDDLVERAEALFADFNPGDTHAAEAGKIRKKRELAAKPTPVPKTARSQSSTGVGPLTVSLIGICVLVALGTEIGEQFNDLFRRLLVIPTFLENGQIMAKVPVEIDWSEPWRLLTPMVIHFGLFHIAFNMMWLYRFGNQIEAISGTLRFLLLVCVAQVAGSIVQFQISGPLFGGMSGVNYALFGFIWMQSKYGRGGYQLDKQTTVWLMGWLVLCATGMVGPIANAAHAMGLATGLLAGLPAYVKYRGSHATYAIEKDSWADLNLSGWQRFDRQFIQPYIPIWFMAIALGVLLLDY